MNKTLIDVERSADGWPQQFDPHAEGGKIRLPNGRVYFVSRSGAWIRQRQLEAATGANNGVYRTPSI